MRLEKVVKKGGKSACIRCIQRAGCIVWVIYQRQSTKFPSAENLSLLLSSSSPLPHFELFSKKQHCLFFSSLLLLKTIRGLGHIFSLHRMIVQQYVRNYKIPHFELFSKKTALVCFLLYSSGTLYVSRTSIILPS